MMGNQVDAEDMTQDVFIQVYRKIGSFRGDAAFTTWLHRLTVNQVLMHFRKRGVRIEATVGDDDLKQISESDVERPHPLPIIDRMALEQAIAKLPPGYRTVLVLHDIEGYEHEEIAGMLGCSVGTSKSQLHKARMRIRDILRRKE